MKIESRIARVNTSEQQVYKFIADFRNFNNFIPEEQISNWNAEEDSCSFSVQALGSVSLNMIEREANKLVKIASDPGKSSQNFTLWIQIKEVEENDSRVKITIEPQVNAMMAAMVKGPLKKFVDQLASQIEQFDFSQTASN